jgi:outer membrane biosynthesis protein TonB
VADANRDLTACHLLLIVLEPHGSWRIFVKNRILSLASIATLAVVFGMISWGSAFAQTTPSTPADQTTPQTQPTPDTPPTQQTPQTQPAPTPEVPPASQQPPSSSTQTPSTPSTQTPSTQTPDAAQTPSSKDNAPANSTPSATAPNAGASASGAAAASDSQSFSGTVVKSGDKYMLKDDAGKTYDIDHQSDVAKFEGKRVRVQGKLDDSGSKILVK